MYSERKYFNSSKRPPAPRLSPALKEDVLSKRIRKLDNVALTQADSDAVYITTNEWGADKVAEQLIQNKD